MNVDYVNIARERRLTALEVLQRRQPALPGMGKLKMAPLQEDGKIVPFRERIVYLLDTADKNTESLNMPMPPK